MGGRRFHQPAQGLHAQLDFAQQQGADILVKQREPATGGAPVLRHIGLPGGLLVFGGRILINPPPPSSSFHILLSATSLITPEYVCW